MVPQIIPGHITALYVFACINLMALFHITLVEADIRVLNSYNQTKAQYLDLPARFGPEFPEEGLYGRVQYSPLYNGCTPMPIPPISEPGPFTSWIALLQRNGCNFDVKVLNAQNAGYIAVIVYNNNSDNLVPMGGGKEADSVIIPSCFISAQDGLQLQEFGLDPSWSVIIDNRVPFNYNLYLLPFAIVVGICFVLMLVFMIAKCVRDLRRRRRARLSREHLKKLPTKKFKKGDPYDMCAICLDEYEEGDKLRILPCSHAYHMKCVDPWLTKNKRNCPVCKRKVIPGDEEDSDSDMDSDDEHDAPSETTPLLTTQTAEQLVATNTAFQTSGGAVSDANSVHPEDIPSEDSDEDEQESPTTSTSVVHVHTPTSTTAMAGARGGGYGSLGRSPSHCQHPDDNPEYRGAVGGVGVYISDDENEGEVLGAPHESELRGILSSEPDEAEVEAEREQGLRVKIISLLKSRRQNRRSRRRDSHEEA